MFYKVNKDKDILMDKEAIKVVFCQRNESFRLAFFLEYYRKLGVDEFYAIDNNSNDGSLEYLLAQPDVHVYFTDESYKDSQAGKDWTTKIAEENCMEQWTLTLDVDEFLKYPYSEIYNLKNICRYFDDRGYEGMLCLFLDLYSNKNLVDTVYKSNEDIFKTCNYYDSVNTYHIFVGSNFPFLNFKGGVRQRIFWQNSLRGSPEMKKIPLVKWRKGFSYLFSTHSSTSLNLASITGALCHFKFLSHFKQLAINEVKRGDRRQTKDYINYSKTLEDTKNFYEPEISTEYKNSKSLIYQNIIACSLDYFDYCSKFENDSNTNTNFDRKNERNYLMNHINNIDIDYSSLIKLWPSLISLGGVSNKNKYDVSDLRYFERQIDKMILSTRWKIVSKIRTSFYKLISRPTENNSQLLNSPLKNKFNQLFISNWWSLTYPFFIIGKIKSKLIKALRKKND